ncbi:UDP-glucose/GDP-mannose dehydrogenase family protein [Actinotalea sp. K2]|uniref:UDP-glucose dehydrogenase family protein n=1 Tax=Actinotalea sp. K2 TaxID=2939438 RepID=UPI002016D143|nr:UDP-glucose/GDP-mannose dehydrogenase family protein [Actinotalea sp. K2]MCL3862727.1 UDP-glucose/GDP-mannose dehydrogenase family protein [Actinotalea sp. K2]
MTQLSVIGCGYLGAVHAACMADLGHEVVGVDVDPDKVAQLAAGKAPFHEPGFDDLLQRAIASGRLRFTTDIAEVHGSQVHFICVGTPQQAGRNAADLTYVHAAVEALLPHLAVHADGPVVVVGKSTVPVGTAAEIAARIDADAPGSGASLVWNPEFLREGFAIQDTVAPDRIVYGLGPGDRGQAARVVLDTVYASQLERHTPLITTDYATAELVKVAANSFLATKISFINAMAELCEATGADVTQLAEAIGHDERIGPKFLRAGVGFGGGCLPKDIRAFMARAGELGVDQALTFLREVDAINLRRRTHVVELARTACGGDLSGARVTVLGAAFKPHSDDVRDSPALEVASTIAGAGAHVTITDPAALENVRRVRPDLNLAADPLEAADRADVVVLLTEWEEYVTLDPEQLGTVVAHRQVIDGRNALDPVRWRAAGWTYTGLGRP